MQVLLYNNYLNSVHLHDNCYIVSIYTNQWYVKAVVLLFYIDFLGTFCWSSFPISLVYIINIKVNCDCRSLEKVTTRTLESF